MEPFIGEIRCFGFAFPPRGWALCAGQLLPINQNQALFAILGTTYGGDGRTNFALPDLRGRVPLHQGSGPGLTPRPLGQQGGTEAVTLTAAAMPAHTHPARCNGGAGNQYGPTGHYWAQDAAGGSVYAPAGDTAMAADAAALAGGGAPHNNLQPYLAMNFCIALQGIFPSRS